MRGFMIFDPGGEPFSMYSDLNDAIEYAKELREERPDIYQLCSMGFLNRLEFYWCLWRYPHIKIK